jgi:hypothetical protein
MCQPGYRYPPYQNGPFKGEIIEKATKEEYQRSFDCLAVDRKNKIALFMIFKIRFLLTQIKKP